MKGIDVSHWNGLPFNSATEKAYKDADFVIVKATQGTTFVDNCWKANADKVLKDGKLLGLYHYAAGANASKEADFFLKTVSKYVGKAVLAIDWEQGQNQAWGSTVWVRTWCNRVFSQTKVKPLIYIQASATAQVASVANLYPLWIAGYPKKNYESWTPPTFPYKKFLAGWKEYTIWQYTSAGGVDRNVANITKTDWLNMATPASLQPTKSNPQPAKKSLETVVAEVRAGKWGNDPQRSQRLLAAGYPAKEIQARVNALEEAKKTPALRVGATVTVNWGACIYGTSRQFAAHVYATKYRVYQITPAGTDSRVVLQSSDGTIIGAVKGSALRVVG